MVPKLGFLCIKLFSFPIYLRISPNNILGITGVPNGSPGSLCRSANFYKPSDFGLHSAVLRMLLRERPWHISLLGE